VVWDSQLISLAYDAAFDPKKWVVFAEALEHSLGGAVVVLAMPQPATNQRGDLIAPSLDPDFIESYRQRYFTLDPWNKYAASLAVGGLASEGDVWRVEPAAGSPFLREWLEPQGLAVDLFLGCVVDRDRQNGVSLLSVFRRASAPGARTDVWLPEPELVSHLRRALRLHFRARDLEAERDAFGAMLDRIPLAAMLVDGRARVRGANRAAQRLLAARDGLALGRDGLDADGPEHTGRLRRVIADAARGDELSRGASFVIERSSGRRPLRAVVKTLAVRPFGGSAAGSLAALFVHDPERCGEPPFELLRSFHGLTVAESALARELSQGRSLAEAARRLGITYGTARQRLGQVFAKTATRRQAELVHLVLSGPESLMADE